MVISDYNNYVLRSTLQQLSS